MNSAAFLFDLTQDVAACRPVARYFHQLGDLELVFFVSSRFRKRDGRGLWWEEIRAISAELGAVLIEVETVLDVVKPLIGRQGLLISASESELNAHDFNHQAFLAAPAGFTRVTLQHGLECIGFNHNAAHDTNFGHWIGMACDIAASWFPPEGLHSVRPDQRTKLMTVGPVIGLNEPPCFERAWDWPSREPAVHGLVCENLHSVRFGSQAKGLFVETLNAFADAIAPSGGSVELRPHPAGRYSEKNAITLPSNVRFNLAPLYKQSLKKFSFGISAPSTVLLDMVWAGIPTAVWTSGDDSLDIGIFEGLAVVSDVAEWIAFAQAAQRDPAPYLDAQRHYVARLFGAQDIPGQYRRLYDIARQAGAR